MKQKFIVQDIVTNLYWYGFYSSKKWTDDITESYMFNDREEMRDWMENNGGELMYQTLRVIEIWN